MIRTLMTWHRRRHPLLWRISVVFWAAAILLTFVPKTAEAEVVELGDLRINFSQMVVLLAVGFAWGDMRQWRAGADERHKEIVKRLGDLEKLERDVEKAINKEEKR